MCSWGIVIYIFNTQHINIYTRISPSVYNEYINEYTHIKNILINQ